MKILSTAIITTALSLGLASTSMAAPSQAEWLKQQKASQAHQQKNYQAQQQRSRHQAQPQRSQHNAHQAQQLAKQQQAARQRAALAQQAARQRAIQAQLQAQRQRAIQAQQQAARQRAIQAQRLQAQRHHHQPIKVVVKPAPRRHHVAHNNTYRVQTGDTLYRIAQRNNLQVQALVNLNGLFGSKASNLIIGTTIRLR